MHMVTFGASPRPSRLLWMPRPEAKEVLDALEVGSSKGPLEDPLIDCNAQL